MATKAELIAGWMKKRRADLVSMARDEGLTTDETMTKGAVCEKLYKRLREKIKAAKDATLLEEKQAEAGSVTETSEDEHNLNAMTKPATYAILRANAAVFGGIMAERADGGRKTITVTTGSGQRWEFPL